jgi:hypothetical protein
MFSDNDAKAMAQTVARSAIALANEWSIGEVRLTEWLETEILPARFIAVAQTPNDCYVVSEGLGAFARLLNDLRPDLNDIQMFRGLYEFCGSDTHNLLLPEQSEFWAGKVCSPWNGPAFDGSRLTFYCNERLKGNCLCITVDAASYLMDVRRVGPGFQYLLA